MLMKSKKTIMLSAIAMVMSLTISNAAFSADAPAAQNLIAIVDSQAILEKSAAMQKVKAQLDKKAEEFKKDSSKKEDYFKNKFAELDKQKSVLAKDAFEQKSDALSQEFNEEQKKVLDKRGVLDKAYNEALQQLDKAFTDVVQDHSKKAGIKIVMHKMHTIYSEESLEITDKVLEAINKKLPTVSVKLD